MNLHVFVTFKSKIGNFKLSEDFFQVVCTYIPPQSVRSPNMGDV